MDAGYVNEGGQLKTKNGQKYVFHGKPTGVFVSKLCVLFSCLIAILAVLFAVIITYFLTINSVSQQSCYNGNRVKTEQEPTVLQLNSTETEKASLFGPNSWFSTSTSKVDMFELTPEPDPPILPITESASGTPNADASLLPITEPSNENTMSNPVLLPTTPSSNATMLGKTPLPNPTLLPPTIGDIIIPLEPEIFDKDVEMSFEHSDLNLRNGWIPQHYKIIIEPNINESINNGSIAIEVERDAKIAEFEPIVLDVHNISISNVRVIRAINSREGEEVDVDFDSEYGDQNSTFIVTLSKKFSDEQNLRLILSMDFVSQFGNTLQGIYRTKYINLETNKPEWMASSQLSPADARRVFPCFDRPDMKANFTISIIRESSKSMSLSNMPLYHTSVHRPGYIKDDFMTSPKMSTYLIAFVVSNLKESHYSDKQPDLLPRIEVWTRPENKNMTHYAYSAFRKYLPYYEHFFAFKNNLLKIDVVTVPDFGYSAMENLGLITFRESALLVPEDSELASSSEHMEYVEEIIAHELAHQWFGNLVTPKWWDDLWLKEGFACYISYTAMESLSGQFQAMDTLSIREFSESMQHDAGASAHAISFNVKSISDLRRIFDPITYSKGTILFRMLNSMIGKEAFRSAIREYIQKYAYENADRYDLWEIMTRYAHLSKTLPENMNIKDIMETWTSKSGYPVVNVTRQNSSVLLTQHHYRLNNDTKLEDNKWFIPITFETGKLRKGHSIPSHWITPSDHQVIINDVFSSANNSDEVFYLNVMRNGYYRVNYDEKLWLALKLNFSTLPSVTRAQILDDSLNLARAEYLSYDFPLTFLMELHYAPDDELLWMAADNGLKYLTYMLEREAAYETFRAFMKSVVRPGYQKYGMVEPDNESHSQKKHHALVAKLACKFNYDYCIIAAHKKFRQWMADSKQNPITPNLKPIIYCTAIAQGSYQEWYFAYKQYRSTTSASEREQILSSLGCTAKPWLLSKYLDMLINGTTGIMKQDGARAFRSIAENPVGFELAFDFLQTNIEQIAEYYGDGFSTLSSMIMSVTTYMNKEVQKEKLEYFAQRTHKLGLRSVETIINLAIEQVKKNILWRNRSYYKLKGFLETIVSDMRINIF